MFTVKHGETQFSLRYLIFSLFFRVVSNRRSTERDTHFCTTPPVQLAVSFSLPDEQPGDRIKVSGSDALWTPDSSPVCCLCIPPQPHNALLLCRKT